MVIIVSRIITARLTAASGGQGRRCYRRRSVGVVSQALGICLEDETREGSCSCFGRRERACRYNTGRRPSRSLLFLPRSLLVVNEIGALLSYEPLF